ncbi:MAG: hypothetical protein KAS72_12120 [Phycisphaerales bacterium]|nr:hypothetical protein [Phycisphaerales bacterium]
MIAMDQQQARSNPGIPFDRMRRVYVSVNRQPSWVVRAALYTGATVMLAVVLLIVIPALLAFLIVFALLSLVHRLRAAVTGSLPRRDGRKNVIVIRRDDHPGT